MSKKIAVIGTGNPLFKDEGIGMYAIEHLEANYSYSQTLEFVDGTTLGMGFVSYITEYDHLIMVQTDTASPKKAGSISLLDLDHFLAQERVKKTVHEVALGEMIQTALLFGPIADIEIVSIVPEDITSVDIGLSPTLYEQFENLIQTILERLSKLDIYATKNQKHVDILINHQLKNRSVTSTG